MIVDATSAAVPTMPSSSTAGADEQHVEVVDGSLCSANDLRRAVVAGAILSGIIGTIAGIGLGYLMGLRDGREK